VDTRTAVRVAGLTVVLGLAVGGCSAAGPGGGGGGLIPNVLAPEMSAEQFCAAWIGLGRTFMQTPGATGKSDDAAYKAAMRQAADDWAKVADAAPQEIRADAQEATTRLRQLADGTFDVKTALEDKSGSAARLAKWYTTHCPLPSNLPRPSFGPKPSN